MRRAVVLLIGFLLAATGCGADTSEDEAPASGTTPAPASTATSPSSAPSARPSAAPSATPSATPSVPPATTSSPPAPLRGIDASHHQGPIDWRRVAGAGIEFAYLKATEGTGFTDPRFAEHRAAATRQGVRVGGYHYFQLCSDGAQQAEHFVRVLGDNGGRGGLAPAVDLELAGSCAVPPPREVLLAEVRAFLARIEQEYGVRPVVYLYPELEQRFGFSSDLASYPQWVRRLGKRPPQRPWHVWQYDDSGSVPGISGGVDLNRMRPVG